MALTKLGSTTVYKSDSPNKEMLEVFPNGYSERDYLARHTTQEFTSLCPVTGQPDFAEVIIETIPDKWLIETKSLKLYLFAYRSENSFMEAICNRILNDIVAVSDPRRCRVQMIFNPRGGIQTEIIAEHKKC